MEQRISSIFGATRDVVEATNSRDGRHHIQIQCLTIRMPEDVPRSQAVHWRVAQMAPRKADQR